MKRIFEIKKYLLKNPISIYAVSFPSAHNSKPESYTADFLYENNDVRSKVLEEGKANEQSYENGKNANNAEAKSQVASLEDRMNQ